MMHFLNQRLGVVEYYYAQTKASFEGIMSKIEAGEPPYVDERHPDDPDDEPAFFEEWQKADAAMTITGVAALDWLQTTLHAFIDRYMRELGLEQQGRITVPGDGWFGRYKTLFHDHLQIDWEASGADLKLLEQVILMRNDFTHNVDLFSFDTFQTSHYAKKYPKSEFADPRGKRSFSKRTRLIVESATLSRAVTAVRTLCEFLNRERYQ